MKRFTFSVFVKREDINLGRQMSGKDCPLALAIRRQFNTNDVFISYVTFIDKKVYQASPATIKFIDNFDERGKLGIRPGLYKFYRFDNEVSI